MASILNSPSALAADSSQDLPDSSQACPIRPRPCVSSCANFPIRARPSRFGISLRQVACKPGGRVTHSGHCDRHGFTSIGKGVATLPSKGQSHVESWTRSPHRAEDSLSRDRQPDVLVGFHNVSRCLAHVPFPNRDCNDHLCFGLDVYISHTRR